MRAPETQVMGLSLTDHYAPRAYVRLAFVWPFDNTREVEAVERIRSGIHCLFARYPHLGGHLVMNLNPGADTQQGAMQIYYLDTIHSIAEPQYVVNHLDRKSFPYTYDELHAEGMPGSKLLNSLLSKVQHVPDLGKPQPIVSITANFFQGGLILHVAFLHVVGDGTGMNELLREWCDFVRNGTCPQTIKKRVLEDYRALIQPKKGWISDGFPTGYEIVNPEEGPTGINSVPNVGLPHPVSARVFTFSHGHLHALKEALNDAIGTANNFWVSTNDCINAMLWLYVTRTRAEEIRGSPHTTYFTPVNIRDLLSAPGTTQRIVETHSEYLGNATMLAQVTRPIDDFLQSVNGTLEHAPITSIGQTPDSPMENTLNGPMAWKGMNPLIKDIQEHPDFNILTKLVKALRQSINDVSEAYVQDRLSFMSRMLPKCHLIRWDFQNYFGPDFFCTSWVDFGADTEWGIPGTLSKHPTYLRKPYVPDDGSSVVLPRIKGQRKNRDDKDSEWTVPPGPYEVWIQLREDHLQKLCGKNSLGYWADRIA